MKDSSRKNSKSQILSILIGSVLGVVAVLALILFVFYNDRSQKAVQAERENYTSEIAIQLTRNIDNIQNSYANEIREGSSALSSLTPTNIGQVKEAFPDRENAKHYLISAKGEFVDTSGQKHSLGDNYFVKNVAYSSTEQVILSHTTLDLTESYLFFGKKIDTLTIDSVDYSGLVIGVSSEQFRKNMTISLFDGVGSGYLITEDGAIFLQPDNETLVSGGYNFFSALTEGGISEGEISQIQSEMKAGESRALVMIKGIRWMIDIKKTQFEDDYIVVAVPLTLTAAQTYWAMALTLIFAFTFIIALSGVMLTITIAALRRKREEDKKAAAVEAQTSFLAKMSHDIRTPLNAVNGMLQLASDPRHSRAEVDGFVLKAQESANYLLELINGMLDLQKINSGKMNVAHEPFSMADLLQVLTSMYKPVIEGKGLNFVLDDAIVFDSDYYGDATKIKEILMNLLSNAMKFTPKGGNVTLAVHKTSLNPSHDEIVLQVRDTGVGMSPEFMARLFQPFEQEKSSASSLYVGTGLGLSIVKSLSELMGGSVQVESALGEGSSFAIHLPLERTGSITKKQAKDAPLVPFNHQRVLLAEDNAINQQIVILLLKERLSLDVDAVDNGQEAVDAFTKSKPGYYSVILLDLRMPVLDGLGAAKAIRSSLHPDAKSIPIIALSANAYAEDVEQSLQAGMNAHLAKPIDLTELSLKLHEYIPSSGGKKA
jgi:two-component system, sensor histidine kinase